MADRAISQLAAVTAMGVTDLFVLEQSGEARSLTGQKLKATLMEWLDGHGGIRSIVFNADDTMTITAADGTAWTSGSLRGSQGPQGLTPNIGANGNWYIGDTDTGVKAQGPQGTIPRVGDNGNWWVGETDTGVHAQGDKGDRGDTPYIGGNGHWWVGETDTGVTAKGDPGDSYVVLGIYATAEELRTAHPTGEAGQAYFVGTADSNVVYQWDVNQAAWVNVGPLKGPRGDTPYIGSNGHWWIGTTDTNVAAQGAQGLTPNIGANGHWWIGTTDTGVNAKGDTGKSAYESAQEGGYTGTEAAFYAALAEVENKVNKSSDVYVTLLASGWTGDAAPFLYTAAVQGVTATSAQDWYDDPDMTLEQLDAWQDARVVNGGQSANTVIFKAWGDKPTVDITLRCILRKDL